MKNVSNRLLSDLTIPGTHETCSRKNVFEFVETQTWPLGHQLLAGIRFLDIRCRHQNNKFKICHEFVYLDLDFDDVLNICRDFLFQNQSEALIMRVKNEYTAEGNTRSFQETFDEYLDFYRDILVISKDIPMLDDVRGKIWVLADFKYEGFLWEMADIQDNYNLTNISDIEIKKKDIVDQLEKSIGGEKNRLFINFCSAYGAIACFPWVVAKETNSVGYDYEGRLGIVVMDFPGEYIITHLIEQNINGLGVQRIDNFKMTIIEHDLVNKTYTVSNNFELNVIKELK
jgi:1-phosphatidylinositol phosphodiesterase